MSKYYNLKGILLSQSSYFLSQWLPDGDYKGDDYVALNPTRLDNNKGSFRINWKTGRWIDHATGESGGNLVSLHAYINRWDYIDSIRALSHEDNYSPPAKVSISAKAEATPCFQGTTALLKSAKVSVNHNQAYAQDLWNQAQAVEGTKGQQYLASRGITCELPPSLRYIPALCYRPSHQSFPCLLALIQKWPQEGVSGVLRIYLDPAGNAKAPVKESKLDLGVKKGGAIRIGTDLSHVIVCEGLETGLSLYQGTGKTVWATLSASNMPNLILPPPTITQNITIGADNDEAGIKAANKAAYLWGAQGYKVNVTYPPAPYKDFNDILTQGKSHD